MAELSLTYEAPASTPEPPKAPPVGEKHPPRDRKHPPEPVPVKDPPAEPGARGPYVV